MKSQKGLFYFKRNQVKRCEKVTIHLPENLIPIELPETVEYSSPFGTYKVTYSFKPGLLEAERTYKYKKSLIMPAEYQAFKTFYSNMVKNDTRQLVFKKK